MPTRSSYAQGTPNWIDLQSPDIAGSRTFYGSLFGWSFENMMGDAGEYWFASANGASVAAIAGHNSESTPADAPARWNTYIAADNVDEVIAKVADAGGRIVHEAFDIPGGAGRMGWIADPSGADVGLWQAGQHIGATLVNEPGSLIWSELISDDLGTALPFYRTVLGIDAVEVPMGEGTYTLLKVDGVDVGGATPPPMPEAPTHWHTYIAVDNTDASVAKAKELGAKVIVEPFDIPMVGRTAVLHDPQGAFFSILQPATPTAQ